MELVFVEVGISGLQTFNIREIEEAMQRVPLSIYFFVVTSRKVSAVLFLKKKAPLSIFRYVFETFAAAISKHSHEKIYDRVW